MFARQFNQVRFDVSITPRAPLQIRSGRKGADPTRPEMECVRTAWGGAASVYIPGSSLKGVLRSYAERLFTGLGVPFVGTFVDTRKKFEPRSPGDQVYAGTSPLGRTFGTLHLKGHLSVGDLLPGAFDAEGGAERAEEIRRANAVEQRNTVAIDRLTGSAAGGALFDQELVVQGRFDGILVMRNVQLYQLALLLLVLRDLDEGYVQLGAGTTRGNGWVGAEVRRIAIETRQGASPAGTLRGLGALAVASKDYAAYGLFDGDELSLPAGLHPQLRLLWDHVEVPAAAVGPFAEALVAGPWSRFMGQAGRRTWIA